MSLDCKNVETCNRDVRPFIVVNFPRAGRVGEWLKPADCKSAAPCGLRRFESSPVHQFAQRIFGSTFDEARSIQATNVREARGTSRPVSQKKFLAWVAQLVERVLGKDEVTGSIPVPGSRMWWQAGRG